MHSAFLKFCKLLFCILALWFHPIKVNAQDDKFPGTWEITGVFPEQNERYSVALQIGFPELKQLYPAQLTISYGTFLGVYNLLLVKKGKNKLAIGRNKVPESESPFSLGAWTVFLNGTFTLETTSKHNHVLVVNRILSKRYGLPMPELINFDDSVRGTAMHIRNFMREEQLQLNRKNAIAFTGIGVSKILNPGKSGAYFGIVDSVELSTNSGHLNFSDNNKTDNDTVSLTLNGTELIAPTDLSKRNPSKDFLLDTGVNVLAFFADNYGKVPPNTGKLNLTFGKEKFAVSFADKADISATFIVAKLYYHPRYENLFSPELLRNTMVKDSFHTSFGEVKLAIWDDAVEDGDSISLNVNGSWLVKGFSVKKKPQFLSIKLLPGVNNIIFVADNLGAIPPNTSILEIIDGRQRKSFSINTDLRKNNLVKIFYDYHAIE